MEYIKGTLQRTLSQSFQQRLICTSNEHNQQTALKPYAYIAYERDDIPGCTGAVLFYADTPSELARRAHINRDTVYDMLQREKNGDTDYSPYLPFIIKKVYLV